MLTIKRPYNFSLSLSVVDSFASASSSAPVSELNLPVRINAIPTFLKIRQDANDAHQLLVSSDPQLDRPALVKTAEWILFAALDLAPFYALAKNSEHFGPIIQRLWGIKPMRPASLFEMAAIAVIEQQISLAAAYRIRERVLARYGDSLAGQWAFPPPAVLAAASLEDLRACGLTYRKSEYIIGIAQRLLAGTLDFEKIVQLSDDEAREILLGIRGFGRWSADYVLVRGLARPDCLPADDLAIQTVAGKILGNGRRFSAAELQRALEPFAPYRGLAAFYLLAHDKLSRSNPVLL